MKIIQTFTQMIGRIKKNSVDDLKGLPVLKVPVVQAPSMFKQHNIEDLCREDVPEPLYALYECDSAGFCSSLKQYCDDKTEPHFKDSDLYWTGRNFVCMPCYVSVADQDYDFLSLKTVLDLWERDARGAEFDAMFYGGA